MRFISHYYQYINILIICLPSPTLILVCPCVRTFTTVFTSIIPFLSLCIFYIIVPTNICKIMQCTQSQHKVIKWTTTISDHENKYDWEKRFDSWCLMVLVTVFQWYWSRKPEHPLPKKITNRLQATEKLYHKVVPSKTLHGMESNRPL